MTVRQIIWTGFFGTLGLYQRPTRAMQQRTDALIESIGLEEVGDSAYGLLSTGRARPGPDCSRDGDPAAIAGAG